MLTRVQPKLLYSHFYPPGKLSRNARVDTPCLKISGEQLVRPGWGINSPTLHILLVSHYRRDWNSLDCFESDQFKFKTSHKLPASLCNVIVQFRIRYDRSVIKSTENAFVQG